jgi:hypothetical protein
VDDQTPTPAGHREALLPTAGIWVAVLAVAASVGVVFVPSFGAVGAAAVALVAMAAAAAGLLLTSARVEVRDGELLAGRARIPVRHLGRVAVVAPERMKALRGREADARAYLCQRSWLPGGVVVEVTDPQDPTPYWLVSSRKPQRLAAAIEQAERSVLSGAEAGDEPPSDGSGQAHSKQTG